MISPHLLTIIAILIGSCALVHLCQNLLVFLILPRLLS